MFMNDNNIVLFESKQDWSEWLEANYRVSKSIWLRIGKKGSWIRSITYEEAIESALCYGWIDAIRKSYDKDSYLQRFTPRNAGSGWSKLNTIKADKLIKEGRMKPSGLAAIEIAKQKGLWDKAYDPQSTIEEPEDFIRELQNFPQAVSFFHSMDSRNRYAILHRIQLAKSEKSRQERIIKFIEMLIEGRKLY
jgi:uncharacterized protein YdeI (YjbR/CyaY-like superfamily)